MKCSTARYWVARSVANLRVRQVVNRVERREIAGTRIVGAAVLCGRASPTGNGAGTGGCPADRRAERYIDGSRGGADIVAVGTEVKDVYRRVAHLAQMALLVGERRQHAKGPVEEFL